MIGHCPICNYKGEFILSKKKDDWHSSDNYACPTCNSRNRHRLIALVLNQIKNVKFKNVLHCSPQKCIKDKLVIMSDNYISIDFPPRETLRSGVTMADRNMDLTELDFPDNYFDLIICSHVIDAIEVMEKAVSEISRVLKSDSKSMALILVPNYEEEKHLRLLNKPEMAHWWKGNLDGYVNMIQHYFETVTTVKYQDVYKHEKYLLANEAIIVCENF